MSKFFMNHVFRHSIKRKPLLSYVQQLVETEEGKTFKTVVAELIEDPYQALSFKDFTLEAMLKNGVSFDAIKLAPINNMQVSESLLNDFNNKLMSVASELFTVKNVEPFNE